MQINKYLKTYQPIIYQTFVNALQNDHLSHAYLISGQPGTPLLETAEYLAKSILCDEPDPLACNNCITCLRIDDHNYPDFIVYNGAEKTIKKEEVNSIEEQFDKTAFESKGIMIYILHLVENMTVVAVNAILKFLEEPGNKIYAFLTTNNESNVLPTILSRCQILRLKLIDRAEVIKDAVQEGVNQDDAELLSYFYNDPDLIVESLEDKDEKEAFKQAKLGFDELLHALAEDGNSEAIYYCETNIIPTIKSKESARLFLDILVQAFEDMMNIKNGNLPILNSYADLLTQLSQKLPSIESSLLEILKCRNLINTNVNVSLLLDHLMQCIIKE